MAHHTGAEQGASDYVGRNGIFARFEAYFALHPAEIAIALDGLRTMRVCAGRITAPGRGYDNAIMVVQGKLPEAPDQIANLYRADISFLGERWSFQYDGTGGHYVRDDGELGSEVMPGQYTAAARMLGGLVPQLAFATAAAGIIAENGLVQPGIGLGSQIPMSERDIVKL